MMIALVFTLENSIAAPTVTVKLTVEIARPKKECKSGVWFCNPKIEPGISLSGRGVNANFTDNGDGTMTIDFLTKLPDDATVFYADSDESVSLPSVICRKFGYERIILVPGTYRISKTSTGQYGSVVVKFSTK